MNQSVVKVDVGRSIGIWFYCDGAAPLVMFGDILSRYNDCWTVRDFSKSNREVSMALKKFSG